MPIVDINREDREEAIELVGQFFRKINSLDLDGLFQIRPRAATKFVDLYLKLAGTDKVVFQGIRTDDSELVSLIIARVEDKPFLVEEKTLYIDIAVTKNGHKKKGYMNTLLKSVTEWASSNGIQSLELRAIAANLEAMEYWRSQGFQEFYVRFRKKLIND